jgi:hypothetical protein
VEAGYALNATSLQWKSLDFQFEESLLQRGAGTESLLPNRRNFRPTLSQKVLNSCAPLYGSTHA